MPSNTSDTEAREYEKSQYPQDPLEHATVTMVTTKKVTMTYKKLRKAIFNIAKDQLKNSKKSPTGAFNQSAVVLREVERVYPDIPVQRVLTCWHDLFRKGKLVRGQGYGWPEGPFFFLPDRDF